MAIGIIAAQTFIDNRGIPHASAYGVITDYHVQPEVKFAQFRLDVFMDQSTAEKGDFSKTLETFKIAFSGATYDTFFAESVLTLVSNTILTKGQEAMLAAVDGDSNKIIDDTLWEAI